MSRIIIGIHGLGNKPSNETLTEWWRDSILEGLKRTEGEKKTTFLFEMGYWAHYLYPEPLSPDIKNPDHPLYIEDPYRRASENGSGQKNTGLRSRIRRYVDSQINKLFLNEDLTINYTLISDFIIHHFFSDLERYYTRDCILPAKSGCPAKTAICESLAAVLRRHRRKKILLIAHSMGSIIAYDVLTQYAADVAIDTFVTIGSPLGLPVVRHKIMAAHHGHTDRTPVFKTPDNVKSNWYNLSDARDKIAADINLHDDFDENERHVRPIDRIVCNDYINGGEENPHKSYGYLRTTEMARIVQDFLRYPFYHPYGWIGRLKAGWHRNRRG